MQKFYQCLFLGIIMILSGVSFTAQAQTAPKKGVIRVKLQPEVALQIGHLPKMRANGVVTTGVTPLDRAARQVKAVSMRRMIPYSPQFEREHARYGLDRWYEVTFDENVTAEEARKVFGSTAGVEVSEVITPMSLIEGDGKFAKAKQSTIRTAAANEYRFNDPRLPDQWHYQNFGKIPYSVEGADINLFDAWNVTTGDPRVLVAIIDGGVDYKHEDLAQNMYVNEAELNGTPGVDDDGNGYVDDVYGYNFCTNSAEIYPHSHGTHVAGTVGAVNNNGIGVAGVAGGNGAKDSGVRMISCQVFESRSGTAEGDFAAALVYAADMGASIAQCSWGWDSPGYKEQAVLDAIDYFTKSSRSEVMNGGLCIFAAGNNGQTGDYYPACYEPVVAVAAMTSELTPASYSNYGEWVDITAPGGLLDYGAAQGVLSTLPNNEYGFNEGTSMATPHVSGIAALILSKYGSPTFVNENLRTQLLTSVNDFYGYGNNSSYAGYFGSGFIDAAKAVALDSENAPEAVTDFDLVAGQDYLQVSWIIPAASDNNVNHHIIYYSESPFDATSDLTKIPTVVADTKFKTSGDQFEQEVGGLKSLTTYYVALSAVNRWGRSSGLSAVKTITTNAGPELTLDKDFLSLEASASNPVATDRFTIGNNAEGLLKWSVAKRTVSASLSSTKRPVLTNVRPFTGKLGSKVIKPYANPVMPEYEAEDYPSDIAYFDIHWANIGEDDKSLPNSLAQWFKVDASEYPDGFNLTHINVQGNYGTNPKIQIFKGDVSISSASLLEDVTYDWWVYGYNIALNQQLYFAPGESFWVVVHFDANQEGYPLGMGRTDRTDLGNTAYMSNDFGKTWTQLAAALKGSSFEADAEHFVWAVTARSLNPDWSKALEINPTSGTVKQGESTEVEVKANAANFVNGNYNFNVLVNTNESDSKVVEIPVSMNISGNPADVVVPKVVNFGNLLVGQTKTMAVEVYNRGYGSFKGSQWGAGIYSDKISSSSEHFLGPDYVQEGFPARTKVTFNLTYSPKASGSHTGTVTFSDVNGQQVKIIVQGSATDPAKLHVDPSVVEVGTLTLGSEPVEKVFKITNQGKYPLEYVFPKFSDEQIEGETNANHKFGYTVASTLEGYTPAEYVAPTDLIGATDISSKFTDSNVLSEAINPGFTFPYYGKSYDRVYISSFGAILFAKNEEILREPLSPTSSCLNGIGIISAYGRQLMMAPNSKVEYAKKDGKFVVSYKDVLAIVYDQDYTPVSFRIEMSANGDVEIYYDSYESMMLFQENSTMYCGINNPECNDGIALTSSDMADYWATEEPTADNQRFRQFNSPLAVRFEAPKASFITGLSSAHGMVSPDETVEITATLAANADHNAGETFNNLAIVTNDPAQEISAIRFNAVIDGEAYVAAGRLENSAINFGEVFRTSDQRIPVTVKNDGHRALEVTGATAKNGKITFNEEFPFTVEAGMSKDIVVTVPTETEGEISDELSVETSSGVLVATLTGKVIGCPAATLNFESVEETVESGAPLSKTLTVANDGNESLVYSITPDPLVKMTIPERADTKTSYAYSSSIDDKSVAFNWVDIETTGLGEQNGFSYYNMHDFVAVDLPFEFPFYGKKYNRMYVYNTGFVSFTERHDDKLWPEPPADFPEGTVYNNIIAPYWGLHSMDQTKTAGTFHYVTDSRAVVSFMEYGNSMNIGVCYQLIIEKDGSFKFQYKGANENAMLFGMFGLAGISNSDATQSIRLPERMVSFNNAVQFTPVKENTLAAGSTDEIVMDFDTKRMGGVYSTALSMQTNVPGKEKIEIPVMLTINGEAKPVWPADISVEQTLGYRNTDYSNPVVQLGACYDAPFTIANEGSAVFTIVNIAVGGPTVFDEWFGEEYPVFMLLVNAPETDWMTGEPTGNYMWQQYQQGMPLEIGETPMQFSIPMMECEQWMTPGTYDIPMTITYVNGKMDGESEPEYLTKDINVKFVVTPCPVMSLDRYDIYVKAQTDDQTTTETLNIGNEGEYDLKYSLRLDPTGVGEVIEDFGGGGIAPMMKSTAKRQELSKDVMAILAKSLKAPVKAFAKSDNYYDTPQDFSYNDALYYPAMPGNTSAFNYGANSLYDVYKEAVHFTAPAEGFNISHIYMPVSIENESNVDVKIEVIQGSDPTGETVIGQGSLHIESQENPQMGQFFVVPLEAPVYVNPNEEFCVVVTYPAGLMFPAYLCAKEEAMVAGRNWGWTQAYGWFDVSELFNDQYGSLGYILTCLETEKGEPWVKLLTAETEGNVAVGETKEVKIAVNAAAARLEKQNMAMLVIKTNDPQQPLINFPIVLDKNGKPVITAPESTVYAKEGETTNVEVTVYDPDFETFTVSFADESGISTLKAVSGATGDAAVVENVAEGTYKISGATEPVSLEIAIAPEFGQAGKNQTFTVTARDEAGHESSANVRYSIEKVNRAPVAGNVEKIMVEVEKLSEVVRYYDIFTDPDGDEMTYEFSIPNNDIVEAYTTDNSAVFMGKKLGTVTATLTATDANGLSSSTSLEIEVADESGIGSVGAESDEIVSLTENPVDNDIRFVSHVDGDITVEIYDIAGRCIVSKTIAVSNGTMESLSVANYPSGIYLMKVNAGERNAAFRVVKR